MKCVEAVVCLIMYFFRTIYTSRCWALKCLCFVGLHSSPCPPPTQVGSRGTFQVQVQPAGQCQRSAGEVVAEETHRGVLPSREPGRTQGLLPVQELAPPTHTTKQELMTSDYSTKREVEQVISKSVWCCWSRTQVTRTKDAIEFFQIARFHNGLLDKTWNQTSCLSRFHLGTYLCIKMNYCLCIS